MDDKYIEACELIEGGCYEAAQEVLISLLKDSPKDHRAINKLGVGFSNRKMYEKAMECFNKSLSINSDYVPSIVNIGNIYQEKGDFERSIELYNAAIAKDPDYPWSYYNLSIIYKSMGKYDEYMKYMKDYKRLYKRRLAADRRETNKISFLSRKFYKKIISKFKKTELNEGQID